MRKLKPWKNSMSDKCTDFPNGTWGGCCVQHDKAYYYGGSLANKIKADLRLYECVKKKGHPIIATIMWLGVTLFGGPYWPHSFRWNKGYPYWESFMYFDRKKSK